MKKIEVEDIITKNNMIDEKNHEFFLNINMTEFDFLAHFYFNSSNTQLLEKIKEVFNLLDDSKLCEFNIEYQNNICVISTEFLAHFSINQLMSRNYFSNDKFERNLLDLLGTDNLNIEIFGVQFESLNQEHIKFIGKNIVADEWNKYNEIEVENIETITWNEFLDNNNDFVCSYELTKNDFNYAKSYAIETGREYLTFGSSKEFDSWDEKLFNFNNQKNKSNDFVL